MCLYLNNWCPAVLLRWWVEGGTPEAGWIQLLWKSFPMSNVATSYIDSTNGSWWRASFNTQRRVFLPLSYGCGTALKWINVLENVSVVWIIDIKVSERMQVWIFHTHGMSSEWHIPNWTTWHTVTATFCTRLELLTFVSCLNWMDHNQTRHLK